MFDFDALDEAEAPAVALVPLLEEAPAPAWPLRPGRPDDREAPEAPARPPVAEPRRRVGAFGRRLALAQGQSPQDLPQSAPASGSRASVQLQEEPRCAKCDGTHSSDSCPHFRGERERHKDAWLNLGQPPRVPDGSAERFVVHEASIVTQPADGNCLFHALSYGLKAPGVTAKTLRWDIAGFLMENPKMNMAGDSIEDWVRWDSKSSLAEYALGMQVRGWGGGIEIAAFSQLAKVNVHVYDTQGPVGFNRISCFDHPDAQRTIHILYQGRMHYDVLVPR